MKNFTLTEEQFNQEWVTFWGNMCLTALNEHFNEEGLKGQLKNAAGALSVDTGLAYPGALIVHINLFTNIAERLARMVCGTFPHLSVAPFRGAVQFFRYRPL